MSNSKRSGNVMTVLFILLIFTTALQAQNPASNQILQMVPGDSIFCIRINNIDLTLNQIDQFLAGASPMPMGSSMLVRMQLAGLLGNPQLNGLDMSGCFVMFGSLLPGEPNETNPISNIFVGILAPVTDYKQLIDNSPNCTQPDDKDISKISKNETPIMLVTQSGNYALLSWANDYDKLIKMKQIISTTDSKGLVNTLNAEDAKSSANEPIWIYGNIQLVSKTFGPMLFAKIEEMKMIMKSLPTNQTGMQTGNVQNVMDMYIKILDILLKETKFVSVAIKPKPDVLYITKTITAIPDTDMANIFAANSSPDKENKLLGYLDNGAMMNIALKLNKPSLEKINNIGVNLLSTMAGKSMTEENIAKMKSLSAKASDCMGEFTAISVSIDNKMKPPFIAKYFIEIKDVNEFNQLTEEAMNIMESSGLMDFYKGLGMETSFEIKRDVDNYKGVKIDSAKFSMKPTDANSPQGQMINKMYGEGFDYQWGIVDGLFVCAVGGDVNTRVHKFIDEVKAGPPEQYCQEIQSALALLPQANKADYFITYNILRLFTMLSVMSPIPIPQMEIQSKSNIVIAGKTGEGRMVVDIAVPKQHIMEIMSTFMTMQQKMMQQQQNQSGTQGTP